MREWGIERHNANWPDLHVSEGAIRCLWELRACGCFMLLMHHWMSIGMYLHCVVTHDVNSAKSRLELAVLVQSITRSSLHHSPNSSPLTLLITAWVGHHGFLSFFLLASTAPGAPLRSPHGGLCSVIPHSFVCSIPEEEILYKCCSDPAQPCMSHDGLLYPLYCQNEQWVYISLLLNQPHHSASLAES